jgi:hypothetical protein
MGVHLNSNGDSFYSDPDEIAQLIPIHSTGTIKFDSKNKQPTNGTIQAVKSTEDEEIPKIDRK